MNKKTVIFQGMPQSMGVYFFRVKQYVDKLITFNNYDDSEFEYILIDRPFTQEDIELLTKASIVHVHRQPYGNVAETTLLQSIKANGGKLIIDIDDYWMLHNTHPQYDPRQNQEMASILVSWLKIADAVTVASKKLQSEVQKLNKNVHFFPNTYSTDYDQFVAKKVDRPDDKLVIGYVAGSSHANDIELLDGVANWLFSDIKTKDKVRFLTAGYDMRGTKTEYKINEEFIKELGNAYTRPLFDLIIKVNGNVDALPISQQLRDKYREQVILVNTRGLYPHDTPYYKYEQILTDNYRTIGEEEQQIMMDNFATQQDLHLSKLSRIWTKPVGEFCNVYDHIDIVIAPLQNHFFNKYKSDLKLVEASTRKLPVVCSLIEPYEQIGVDGHNCLQISHVHPNQTKYWYKAIKKLVLDEDLRKSLGENLFNKVFMEYNFNNQIESRIKLYKDLCS